MTDELTGTNPHAVIELLKARAGGDTNASGSRKLALVVEGGGMRGVLSAGSLLALDLLGFQPCFDEIYAASAGGVNAAYFLSGQGLLGITIYFDSISNRRFFNPYRPTKIVDIEYVYDHIVPHVKSLDEAAIRSARARLYISVTDAHSGQNVLIDASASPDPICRILKASSALPVLYNRTVQLASGEFVDGGVTDAMPVGAAVTRGCTDILVLSTRPRSYLSSGPNMLQRALLQFMVGRRHPKLMAACLQTHECANRSRRLAAGDEVLPGVNVATICPTLSEQVVGRTTIKRDLLVRGAHLMAAKTFRLFAGEMAELGEVFATFESARES